MAKELTQLVDLLDEIDRVSAILENLKKDTPAPFTFDIRQALNQHFAQAIKEYDDTLAKIKLEADTEIQARVQERNAAVRQAELDANKDIQPIIDKHAELLSYKDKLREMLIQYNITPTDISIDANISREEYETLLDVSLDGCKKLTNARGMKFIEFFKKELNASTTFTMIIGLWVASPLILIFLFAYMYYNTARIYKRVDKLRIAESIMYDSDLDRYLKRGEIEEIPEADVSDVEEARDMAIAELLDKDPRKQMDMELRSFASKVQEVEQKFATFTAKATNKHESTVAGTENYLTQLKDEAERIRSSLKMFGDSISEEPVLDMSFTLGRDRETVDVKYSMALQNIVFKATGEDMIEFMKLVLCNMLLNVQAKSLYVRIFDPHNLGAAFSEFFNPQVQEYIDVSTASLDEEVNLLRKYVQDNVKLIGKKDINVYNRECFDIGKITVDYKLLIILSGTKKIQEMELLTEFMKYSAQYGVFVWLYHADPLNGMTFYDKPYANVQHPLVLTPKLLETVMTTYTTAVVDGRGAALPYVTKYINKIIPSGKDWTFSTNKGIGINFGLEEGDPMKGYEIYLGDRAVHGLMVGTTGAGKSATINQVLMTLLRKYSPRELELVMVDFKNVEFAAFTDTETNISRIPHAKIIAGTKDGEYAISIFEYLCAEMDRRTEIFAKIGKTNIEGYNNYMRENGEEDKCLPRILLLIDEFQVMFTEVDQKSVDLITKSITSLSKLARFCGCHMWFTSQSMKGTLSKDIMDQFALRIALFCSKDTSEAIIGSKHAGEMKSKVGWLYTNTAMGEDKTATKLWRVPYLDKDKDLPGQLDFLENLCTTNNAHNHKAIFYNEDKQHWQQELFDFYENNPSLKDYPRLMVLGERTSYSLNKAPINFNLMLDDSENIFMAAFEQKDALNLSMMVIDNVLVKKGARLIIHSADKDTYTLLEVEKYVQEDILHMTKPNFALADWIEALEGMVESRSKRSRDDLTPIYFLAIQWDKYRGFGVDEEYRLVDRMKTILRGGPSLGIHFIFLTRQVKDMPSGILNNFNHKICAKCSESDSFKMIDSARAEKLPNSLGFAIYLYGSLSHKFKIYQHVFSRELEKREIEL
jgi:hypothetical protein